jgi:hypothetical protein
MEPNDRDKLMAEIKRQRSTVLAASDAMQDNLLSFALVMPRRLRGPVSKYVGHARGVALSDKPDQDAGWELLVITSPLLDYFHSRGWRRALRRHYVREARRLLEVAD